MIESKHWSTVETYRTVFLGYAAIGALKFLLTLMLSSSCEAEPEPVKKINHQDEHAPLLSEVNANQSSTPQQKEKSRLWPFISPESRSIVFRLCILFAFDNLASGLAPMYVITD